MKFLKILIPLAIISSAIWYFGIKVHDYEISFKLKGTPSGMYHKVYENISKINPESITDTIFRKSIKEFTELDTEEVVLDWNFEKYNDSLTLIKVGAKSKENSLKNRFLLIKGSSDFSEKLKQEITLRAKALKAWSKEFRIEIIGVEQTPSFEYIAVENEVLRIQKARQMILANADIVSELHNPGVDRKGVPFLYVDHWQQKEDKIKFRFGFPVKIPDTVSINQKLVKDSLPSRKAIKAVYHGNYRQSDQAWFALQSYAKQMGFESTNEILEIFYNDPMQGGNDRNWKAEIFLFLKN